MLRKMSKLVCLGRWPKQPLALSARGPQLFDQVVDVGLQDVDSPAAGLIPALQALIQLLETADAVATVRALQRLAEAGGLEVRATRLAAKFHCHLYVHGHVRRAALYWLVEPTNNFSRSQPPAPKQMLTAGKAILY